VAIVGSRQRAKTNKTKNNHKKIQKPNKANKQTNKAKIKIKID
jgi:hypothetical protein